MEDTDLLLLKPQGHICFDCGKDDRLLSFDNVYCMDCQEGLKRIKSETIDLILTDPEYEVDFMGKQKALLAIKKMSNSKMKVYENYQEASYDYDLVAKHFYRVLKKDAHCYLFVGHQQIGRWITSMTKAGFKFCQLLAWKQNKVKFDMTMGDKFRENKEQVLFFQKGWRKLNFPFNACFEFDSSKTKENEWHLCPKPYDLLKTLIEISSNRGDIILDAFAGSGEHLVSSMKLGRHFIGFEISDVFHQKIQGRLDFHRVQSNLLSII